MDRTGHSCFATLLGCSLKLQDCNELKNNPLCRVLPQSILSKVPHNAGPRSHLATCTSARSSLPKALKTKMSNQAQIKHKLNATVHYCSRSKPLLTASTKNTRTNLRFLSAQVTQTSVRCELKEESHKSRTARTQENYLKAFTKSKNMVVRFGKQAKHFSTGFKRGAAGKNTLLHRKMQETLQKPN